ncbi:hypothetical protein [Azospirillum argentinense]|uniref:hypothetical protein n=1 Tax=Azospirillum argentinense TaxID=2970906 RepID=UPI0011AF6663|nr:hypothetical protein [Azospirillum argentinense]
MKFDHPRFPSRGNLVKWAQEHDGKKEKTNSNEKLLLSQKRHDHGFVFERVNIVIMSKNQIPCDSYCPKDNNRFCHQDDDVFILGFFHWLPAAVHHVHCLERTECYLERKAPERSQFFLICERRNPFVP